MLCLVETRRSGKFSPGEVLFTSQTNTVDIKFQADSSVSYPAFELDAESVPCNGGNGKGGTYHSTILINSSLAKAIGVPYPEISKVNFKVHCEPLSSN